MKVLKVSAKKAISKIQAVLVVVVIIIAGLGIIPRFQRKGLGTVLGMAAWNYFKEADVKELKCEVYIDNITSYTFISSLGFEEYDTTVYKSEDFQLDT